MRFFCEARSPSSPPALVSTSTQETSSFEDYGYRIVARECAQGKELLSLLQASRFVTRAHLPRMQRTCWLLASCYLAGYFVPEPSFLLLSIMLYRMSFLPTKSS